MLRLTVNLQIREVIFFWTHFCSAIPGRPPAPSSFLFWFQKIQLRQHAPTHPHLRQHTPTTTRTYLVQEHVCMDTNLSYMTETTQIIVGMLLPRNTDMNPQGFFNCDGHRKKSRFVFQLFLIGKSNILPVAQKC